MLSNLKTAISGAYHAFKFEKYAQRYLAEFQYRFNRRFNLKTLLQRLARAAAFARPRPEWRIRLAEVHRYSGKTRPVYKSAPASTSWRSWAESLRTLSAEKRLPLGRF